MPFFLRHYPRFYSGNLLGRAYLVLFTARTVKPGRERVKHGCGGDAASANSRRFHAGAELAEQACVAARRPLATLSVAPIAQLVEHLICNQRVGSSSLSGGTSASATAVRNASRRTGIGGERGIRTLETVPRLHTFQACAFDHSATSPAGWTKSCPGAARKAASRVNRAPEDPRPALGFRRPAQASRRSPGTVASGSAPSLPAPASRRV